MTYSYQCPTVDAWLAIADAIEAKTGFATTLEGGGAACTFIRVELPNGRRILFGDVNETWMGDVYADEEAESMAEMLEGGTVDTSIPTSDHDAERIAAAFAAAVTDMRKDGN